MNDPAFENLVRLHLKSVYNFVYRYVGEGSDAEDVTQETFVKAWKNFKRFDGNKSFKTWIFSIAKNTALDFLKKKKTIPFSQFENEEGYNSILEKFADDAPLPQEMLQHAENAEILSSATAKLSAKYRIVLFLHYHRQFTFREIAEALSEPLDTVKSRHHRALGMLRSDLLCTNLDPSFV